MDHIQESSEQVLQLQSSPRVPSIDITRGVVMVIMALDHVRDFIHHEAIRASPTDLSTTTLAIFLTRWVTHICAPAFALTAGLAAWFWWQSAARTKSSLSLFLLKRGAILILIELSIMQVGYSFSFPAGQPVFLLVLWVLGLSMIVLSMLIWLPRGVLFILALSAIMTYSMLGNVSSLPSSYLGAALAATYQVSSITVANHPVIMPYPLIPWCSIMVLGFCFGPYFMLPQAKRRRLLVIAGMAMLAVFTLIRFTNLYGDPALWKVQQNNWFTILSFLNVTKYPASPLFILLTIGATLLMLSIFENGPGALSTVRRYLKTLGQAPLFFYVFHFFVAHLLAIALQFAIYGMSATKFAFLPFPTFGGPVERFPIDFGSSLEAVFAVWLLVLTISIPLACRYARAKANRFHHALRYL